MSHVSEECRHFGVRWHARRRRRDDDATTTRARDRGRFGLSKMTRAKGEGREAARGRRARQARAMVRAGNTHNFVIATATPKHYVTRNSETMLSVPLVKVGPRWRHQCNFFHFCLNYLLLNTFLLSFALILYVYSLLLVRDERSLGLITIDEGHGARRG